MLLIDESVRYIADGHRAERDVLRSEVVCPAIRGQNSDNHVIIVAITQVE